MERPIAIVGGQVQWGHVSLIQWGQALGSLWSSVPEKTSELAGGGGTLGSRLLSGSGSHA